MTIATTIIETPLEVEVAAGARAAAGTVSAVAEQIEALWREGREAARRRSAAMEEELRLTKALPWWAKDGPGLLRADGSFVIDEDGREVWHVGWPAIEGPFVFTTDDPTAAINIRPSPSGLAGRWRSSAAAKLPAGHPDRQRARARHRHEVRALVARLRRQRQLRAAAGIDALNAEYEALNERIWTIEDEIEALARAEPNATAASACLLIALKYDMSTHEGPISTMPDGLYYLAHTLSFLRPLLSGSIAADVAELLDNPERSVQEHPLWKL